MDFQEVKTDNAPAAIGPYSQAVISGGFVFTSGQIPIDPVSGALVEGGIEEQTKQVIRNLTAVLSAAGVSLTNVVKTTCFIKDMNDFARFNDVYAGFFSAPFPARSCIEAARLPKDVLVEIEAVATIR